MKILSVDDSAMIRRIIRGSVEVLNYEFLEAADGLEALEVLNGNYEDVKLILLDWNMPRMDGIELLEELKKNHDFKNIPVMMVTTEGESENFIKALQAGAINYIIKPFSIEELTKKILECFGEGEI